VRRLCGSLRAPVTLNLTTADGLLDEIILGDFAATSSENATGVERHWRGAHDAEAARDSAIGERLAAIFDRPDLDLQSFNAVIYVRDDGDGDPFLSGELWAITDVTDDSVISPLSNLAQFTSAWLQATPAP
jgi:hypothetical protein